MLQDHINHISSSRLSTYRDHFYSNDKNLNDHHKLVFSVALYTSVQHRSSIFFPIIQEIEVAVRNAIAECLRNNAPNKDLKAYFHFLANDNTSPLSQKGKKLLKISIANRANENDMIANITFGFWINLLNISSFQKTKVFNSLFQNAFPNFRTMYLTLKQVCTFRNDLYHQDKAWDKKRVKKPEHIIKDYKRTYLNFEEILTKIAPERIKLLNVASLNAYYKSLNFDLQLFNQEINWLALNI